MFHVLLGSRFSFNQVQDYGRNEIRKEIGAKSYWHIVYVDRTKWKKQMTARVKIAERSGLWPSVELTGPYGSLQQTFLCPLFSSLSGDSDEAGESRTEEEASENDEEDEDRQDINVDDE